MISQDSRLLDCDAARLARAILPDARRAQLVFAPPGDTPAHWRGAPTAIVVGAQIFLAVREREPDDRGIGISIFSSPPRDGVRFTEIARIARDASMGADSFERPALVIGPGGSLQLYFCMAQTGTKDWWIEVIDVPSADPADLVAVLRRPVFPRDGRFAYKDPVIYRSPFGTYRAFITRHYINGDPSLAVHMDTVEFRSSDTINWFAENDGEPVLSMRSGKWDATGARLTAIHACDDGSELALYDGRDGLNDHEAANGAGRFGNFDERTGVAVRSGGMGPFTPLDDTIAASPHAAHPALRYVCILPLPDGRIRTYYEMAGPDGAKGTYSELINPRT